MQRMNEEDRRVIGGVDAHADTHQAAALDDRGMLLGTKVVRSVGRGLPGVAGVAAWVRGDRSGRGRVDRLLRGRSDPPPARRGRAGARGQPAARTHAPATRQDRRDRCRARRTPRAQPPQPGKAEADHRDRRGDPAAARRPRERGEVTLGRDAAARRSDPHRSQRASRAARRTQDAEGPGRALPAPATRPQPAQRPDQRREARAAQPGTTHRAPRRRDR